MAGISYSAMIRIMGIGAYMDVIISHKSALEYWRLYGNNKISSSARQRRKRLPDSIPKLAIVRDEMPSSLTFPINIMVGGQSAKRTSKIVRARAHTGPIPEGCFVGIADGLAVSSPSLCLFQIAGELPLVKLIELGFELCGTYSLPARNEYVAGEEAGDKTLYNRPQLTNTKTIKAFAKRMKGVNGQQKVSQALPYIANGSGSPMETILIMLLTLPYKRGGYGLPVPELNTRIDFENAGKRRSGKSYYVCDLFWPKANLAVEYDSDFYHTGAERIASDSERRLNLDVLGIKVITVTSRLIRNEDEFDKLAVLIAGKINKRLRYKNPQFSIAKRELRCLLL